MRKFKRTKSVGIYTIIIVCSILSLYSSQASSQSSRYQRKSISYVDALLYASKTEILPQRYERYLLDAIHTKTRLPRFDYNPIPEELQQNFRKNTANLSFTEEKLGEVIAQELAPAILKVLDIEKELRAQNLVTEAQKQTFVATKAREIGITAEQVENVLNSAYVYVPFITGYRLKLPKGKEEVTIQVDLEVGLIYYHLVPGDDPKLEKVATIRSTGSGSADKEKKYYVAGLEVSPQDFAFYSAAQAVALNLQVATRNIQLFRLMAPIASIEKRRIYFPLGREEGLRLDDPFYVGEYVQSPSGKLKFQKSGFVRVMYVAEKNKKNEQFSIGYAIRKGDWARGMTLMEHPRLPFDLAFKPRVFNLTVERGIFLAKHKDLLPFLIVFNDYQGVTAGFDLDIHYNIAELTKKRQTFLIVGATGGLVPVKYTLYDPSIWSWIFPKERGIAALLQGYVGRLRRFYLGPTALHYEWLIGIQSLAISDEYNNKSVTIYNNSLGARINLGLEYALNIDTNIGLFAGFCAFPPMDWWTIKYKEKEYDIENYANFAAPKIYSFSPTFGFYIHYSLPSLGFNPFAMAEAQGAKIVKDVP